MSINFNVPNQHGISFNRKVTQKVFLTLLLTALAAIPLWLGLEHAHSAPAASASPPPPAATSSVSLTDVPAESLIGEQVKFKVTFKNPGNAIGYGPFIDLVLDAGGANMTKSSGCSCDGITFVKAEITSVNGGPVDVTPPLSSQIKTSPCGSVPSTNVIHPFAASGVQPLTLPVGSQLVTIALPFGSYNPTTPQIVQPEIVVEVTAMVSNFADYHVPLKISARSGFQFGMDPLANAFVSPFDLPILSDVSLNSTQWAAQAQTTPTIMIIKKKYLGPEDETATGPNFIGFYPLKYELTVDIAAGQTVSNVVLSDCLPDNMAFHQIVSLQAGWTVSHLPVIDAAGSSPNCLTVNSPSLPITGIPGPDATVIFEFFIPDVDAHSNPIPGPNCVPVQSKNDIKAECDWKPLDPCDQTPVHVISDVTPVDHTLSDKCIAIQKKVTLANDTGASGPTPGDTLRYELNFQISDFKTINNILISDVLSDGQTFLLTPAPTLKVTDKFAPSGLMGNLTPGPALSVQTSPTVSCQGITGGTAITFNVSNRMTTLTGAPPRYLAGILTGGLAGGPASNVPATGQIVFFAKIADHFLFPHTPGDIWVDKDDPMDNCVGIKGIVDANVDSPAIPQSTGLGTKDDSKTATAIVTDFNKKTVYAVMHGSTVVCGPTGVACSSLASPPEVRPGDQVTFRIEKTIPSTDAEQLTIEDFLPLPVFDVNDPDANGAPGPAWVFTNSACSGLPAPGHSCLGPTDMLSAFINPRPNFFPNPVTNSLKFDYGNFNDTFNHPRKIDLLLTSTVTNKPFADDLFLTNEALECENNTFGVRFCQAAIAQVKLREPKLVIRKGVIATNNPFGHFTNQPIPATGTLAQAPTGVTFSQSGVVGTVNSNALAAGFIDSNLSNVDANDLVTYAITIENVGGAAAYDAKIEDIIPNISGTPSCFTIVPGTIKVQRGTGVPVNPLLYQLVFPTSTGGFTVTSNPLPIPIAAYNPANGANIVVITFQAKILANILPGCCDNRAKLLHYSSVLNGPDFVSAGFAPPFDDLAQVCVNPTLTKSLVATSEPHTTGSNLTIGEIARYRLSVVVPEGGVLPNFQVIDALPAGMKFLPGSARVAFIANGPGITHPFPPVSSINFNVIGNQTTLPFLGFNPSQTVTPTGGAACGAPVTFNLGNIQNNDNDTDQEFVVIEFNALVCNASGNQNGVLLPNKFSVSAGGNQIATSNTINAVVVEPNLTISKTVSPTAVVQGGTVTYTVTSTNTGTSTADAFDVQFADTLPAGLTFVSASTTVAGSCFGPVISGPSVTCSKVPLNGVVTITYKAVANPATCPTTLTNQAKVTWTSLPANGTPVGLNNTTGSITPGPSGAGDGERNGVTPLLTLNDYAATALAPLTVECPSCVQAPQVQSMVGWWPLDEPNGATIINDIALFNNQGVPQPSGQVGISAPVAGAGKVSGALYFSAGRYVDVPDHPEINFGTGDLSIDAWVRPTGVGPALIQPIVDKIQNNVGYSLYIQGQQLHFSIGGSSFVTYVSNTSPITPNVWTHVAVTVARPNTVTLYVNGNVVPLQASPGLPGGSTNNSTSLWIGESRVPGNRGEIGIDELELFKKALTLTDVQKIYNAGSSGKCKCSRASNETITCNPNGTFSYTFNLTNLSGFNVTGVNFSSSSIVTITPTTMAISLPPGGSTTVTVTISGTGAVSGASICFTVGLVGPPPAHDCRADHCITLPNCSVGCAPRPPGMVGWWPMSMQNGAVNDVAPAPDSLVNNVGFSPAFQPVAGNVGGVGGALFFGGPAVQVAPQSELDFGTGDFSMDAWVRIVTAGPTVIAPIVDKFTMPGGPGFAFYVRNQKLELNINGTTFVSTGAPMLFANPVANTGPWYLVAVSVRRNPAQVVFYVNGTPAGNFTAVPTNSVNNGLPMLIGGTRLMPGVVTGGIAIDELELFKSVVAPGQFQSIFHAGPIGKCP